MTPSTIFSNPQWTVTTEGHLKCRDRMYEIDRCTLSSIDWVKHMGEKGWVNLFYFQEVLNYSLLNTAA